MGKQHNSGFSAVEVLVVILIIVVLGGVGYIAYTRLSTPKETSQSPSAKQSQTAKESEDTPSDTKTISLNSGAVALAAPSSWENNQSNCVSSPGAGPACLDGAALVPSKTLTTGYGNGTEYFTVYANVYANASNKTPQKWLEEDYGTIPDPGTSETVNGNTAYYWEQNVSKYDEVNYVITGNGKAVYVRARLHETFTDSKGATTTDDFTQYRAAVDTLARSITIK